MSNRLVVLGGCGGWPQAGRACSGFVVEYQGARLVLDLGYGTLPRLFELTGSFTGERVDAVIVTHEHSDHMVDLHGLFRARWFGRQCPPPISLYAPRGVVAQVARMEQIGESAVEQVFDWHALPARPYQIGPFRLESWALPHWVPNAGVRLTADNAVLAYSGDTGPHPALARLGHDADLFVVDATSRSQQPRSRPIPDGQPQLHLSARQAGQVAAAAAARRLMLTHFWPGNDREQSRAEARESFPGDVLLAEEGLVVPLP